MAASKKKPPKTQEEKERLFEQHKDEVIKVATRFGLWKAAPNCIEREDLLQAGYLGLWRAVDRWDESKGFVPTTFLRHAIFWALQDAIEDAKYGRRRRRKDLIDHTEMLSFIEEKDQGREES